jgi:hypothetical protein
MFGQLPLSQMVWSLWVSTSRRTLAYSGPTGSFTLSQLGFRFRSSGMTGSSITGQGYYSQNKLLAD